MRGGGAGEEEGDVGEKKSELLASMASLRSDLAKAGARPGESEGVVALPSHLMHLLAGQSPAQLGEPLGLLEAAVEAGTEAAVVRVNQARGAQLCLRCRRLTAPPGRELCSRCEAACADWGLGS